MEGFVSGLKAKYRDSLHSQVEQQRRPHYHSNKLLQLTLVPRKQGEHNFTHISSAPRHRKEETADCISLAYGDLFKPAKSGKRNLVPIRKVLLEGGAGIGKTTFCVSIVEDWANGKLFQEYELVLFLPLYERKVASASTLPDLFEALQKSNSSAVASDVSKRKGEGVLIIADGWDVVGESKCSKGSFLYNLLFGDVLCLASVLVTSRPTASAPLHTGNNGIDRFMEILGFNEESIVEYIQSQSNRYQSIDGLLEQMECNPLLESLCRIPLGCAIICHMWHTHDGFPRITMTKLSQEIVSRIVSCNIGIELPSIDALPRNLQKPWQHLCQFAFRTLTRNPTPSSAADEEINLSGTEIFGLLEYIQGDSILFRFTHPIFREYLAALYVEKRLPKLQLHSVHTKTMEFTLFWRYLYGICDQMNTLDHITQVLCNFLSDNSKYLLCHCAFEAKNNDTTCREMINLMSGKFGSKMINFGNPQTAHDCKAVLYMISNMPHTACDGMEICFNGCKFNTELINEFADVLVSKRIQVTALDLSNNHLPDNSIANLFHKPVSAFYSLEKLFLCNNKITSEGISAIIATLEKSPSRKLKQLDLSFNPLTLSDLHILQRSVSSGYLCRLEILFLKESLTSDSTKNIRFVTTFSSAIFSHCKHLKRLDLSRNDLGEPGSPVLSKIISQLTSINKSIDLLLNREYMSEVDKNFIAVMEDSVRRKGTIDHTVAHGVIVGPGRSGKNSLMNRLMGQDPPSPDIISPSTGVLETVVKVEVKKLLTVAAAVCNLMWKKLDYDEEALELMMTTVRSHDADDNEQDLVTHTSAVVTVEGKDSSAAPDFLPKLREVVKVVKGSFVSKSSRERKGAAEKVEEGVSELSSTNLPPVQEGPLDIFKRAVKLRRMDALREHLESSWSLYLTNTGGQMEFQELLPVLVCGPSVFFITFPLHKDLHEHYTVQYQYPDGSEKTYPSPSTLMDEILQTLATIAALDCTGLQYDQVNLKPKIFFIGTHKDQIVPEPESTTEDIIQRIDKELQERIKQTSLYEQGSIEFATAPDRLVFTVNNLAKDDSDFRKIRTALQEAIERYQEFTIKCPSTWLIFSLVLRAKQKSSPVLSYRECFNIAQNCGISDRGELNDALFFIHTRLGLLRYFCVKELNELVVVDPQILFDTITSFVVKTFVNKNVKANEMDEFHKRGMFSMKIMEEISKKSHSDAQLPLKWLLHLLHHLKIAAFFKDDKGNEKCFFPSVLFHAPKPLLKIASNSGPTDPPPFLVAFRSGFCPRGIPGALITYLMMNEMKTKIIWKLRSSRVYRNQVSFRVGPCDITIKILPTHLKVYLDPESGTADRSKVMVTCKEAYLQLQRAMKFVTMGYRECDYYFAFSCTRPECKDHPHPAEIILDTKTLECIVHDRPSDLPENYELWMPQLGK
jgi:GTPase SAR1 family protein